MDTGENVRHIPNSYPQFDKNTFNLEQSRKKTLLLLIKNIGSFYKSIKVGETKAIASKNNKTQSDYSLFDGAGGYLIAYVKLYLFFKRIQKPDLDFLEQNVSNEMKPFLRKEKYKEDITIQIKKLEELILQIPNQRPDITFFFSPVGIYLVTMIYYDDIKNIEGFSANFKKILDYTSFITKNKDDPNLYHELLYGTAGYLYNLLFIQKNFHSSLNENQIHQLNEAIKKIFIVIINSGFTMKEDHPQFRLAYNFHKREYLGGAHGLFGICNILMITIQQNPSLKVIQNCNCEALIQKSIQFCSSLQLDSGNFPSGTHKKETDFLVQFCHGSPGAVVPLIFAAQLFGDQSYVQQSIKAGEDIWKYGILKKGYGICHGISGNAYPFLSLYQKTKDQKWLYYAHTFAQVQENNQMMEIIRNFDLADRYVVGSSDYPYSYMMGLSGDLAFITDCLYPDTSLMLGYEI